MGQTNYMAHHNTIKCLENKNEAGKRNGDMPQEK